MLSTTHNLPKTVTKAVKLFLQRLELEVDVAFFRYAESSRIDGFMQPAFWYQEQQTKTFVTTALGNICAGSVLQEPPVERSDKKNLKPGKVDYFCKFGDQRFFIEVKQKWIENAPPKRLNLWNVKGVHRKCYDQIQAISVKERENWGVDYAIGMTIAPVRSDMVKQSIPILVDDIRLMDANNSFQTFNFVHAISCFRTRVTGNTSVEWEEKDQTKKEDYPCVFILWCVRKF